jgi:5-hydroxyisourate hydrolase
MKTTFPLLLLAGAMLATPASAAEISTHVLDLARGDGGPDVPVTLMKRDASGQWSTVGKARTDANGRVRSFGSANFAPGTYRLTFDMSRYPDAAAKPFFPEITVAFTVSDNAAH